MKTQSIFLSLCFLILMAWHNASAQDVGITQDIKNIIIETDNGSITIERDQNNNAVIDPDYAKTSRACPPFCVQPMKVAEGVESVGELEVLDFLKEKKGLLIDARTEQWYFKGTIPSSRNIPYVEITTRMDELGCTKDSNAWDCKNAKNLVLYCNGPWCGQSPTAIKALLREGYPPSKLKYYRGGMQAWKSLGLTVVEGGL